MRDIHSPPKSALGRIAFCYPPPLRLTFNYICSMLCARAAHPLPSFFTSLQLDHDHTFPSLERNTPRPGLVS